MELVAVRHGIAEYSLVPHFRFPVYVNLVQRPCMFTNASAREFKSEIQTALNDLANGVTR
jgi:hypothetical protein